MDDTSSLTVHYTRPWFSYLPSPLQDSIKTAVALLEHFQNGSNKLDVSQTIDYSFVVFLASRSYEGFLKHYLKDIGLISDEIFASRRLRIGRALNPDVSMHQRDEWWLYDDLVQMCGAATARQLWETWLKCRNHVFHYFPEEPFSFDLDKAQRYLLLLLETMEQAVTCQSQLLE